MDVPYPPYIYILYFRFIFSNSFVVTISINYFTILNIEDVSKISIIYVFTHEITL